MLTRKNIVKLITVLAIIIIGSVYWYYADRRSSPIEEIQRSVESVQ